MGNTYIARSSYLIISSDVSSDGRTYKGISITNQDAIKYYKRS